MAQWRTVRRFLRRQVARRRDHQSNNDRHRPAELSQLMPGSAPGTIIVQSCHSHWWYRRGGQCRDGHELDYNAEHLSSIYNGTFIDDYFKLDCSECLAHVPRNPRLCDACQKWNLAEYALRGQGDLIINDHAIALAVAPTDCLMCRFVVELVYSKLSNTPADSVPLAPTIFNCGLWLFDEAKSVFHLRNMRENGGKVLGVLLVVICPDGRQKVDYCLYYDIRGSNLDSVGHIQGDISCHARIQLTYEQSGVGLLRIDLANNTSISIPKLQRLIAKQEVRGMTSGADEPPRGIRLIDTYERRIVEPMGCNIPRYVALSWVWASSAGQNCVDLSSKTLGKMTKPGGVTEEYCPYVIWDAMRLCEDLHERYLWTDRLCILQDDKDDIERQIAQMDRIYSQAALTIVALADYRTFRGLPGVRDRPREPRPLDLGARIVTHGNVIALDIWRFVNETEWGTRGWTLQEGLLSKQYLYISNYAWLLTKGSHVYSEDAGLLAVVEAEVRGQFPKSPGNADKLIFDPFDYVGLVKNYTDRKLTYQTDILNAFAGVAGLVSQQLNTRYLFGLFEEFLPWSLLWSHDQMDESSGKRKAVEGVPSWSWAAWNGTAYYDSLYHERDYHPAYVGPLVDLHYSAPAEGIVQLHYVTDGINDPSDIYHGWSEETSKACNVLWADCPHNRNTLATHNALDPAALVLAGQSEGALIFNTTVSSLALFHTVDRKNAIYILDRGGRRIGHLSESSQTRSQLWLDGTKTYEFIVLSVGSADYHTRYYAEQGGDGYEMSVLASIFGRVDDQDDLNHFWTLNVMLIERDNDQPLLCRRVAIGCVVMKHWKACNPKWETIVLI